MLQLQQIKSTTDKYFKPLINLFENSFPPNERRDVNDMKNLVSSSKKMIFNAIVETENEKLQGLMIYWKIEDFYYLEYFAVIPEMRNQKIGERALILLKEIAKGKTLILEAEPDDNELAVRRIKFYERNGFEILDKNYIQPPYSKDKRGVPLWIMGITKENENIANIVETMKKHVYFCSF